MGGTSLATCFPTERGDVDGWELLWLLAFQQREMDDVEKGRLYFKATQIALQIYALFLRKEDSFLYIYNNLKICEI
jgi:hypothetical protein